tara:strand:+ start:447 stop:623 length:177 start_codon:yes stop_codon:yes gene_type:complete
MGNLCPCFDIVFKYFNLENYYYEGEQDEEKLNKMKPKVKKEKEKEVGDEVWVLIQPGY